MQRANQQMSGYAPSQDEPDDEAMMDFLAGREEFVLSIEEAAQTALGRRSHGVGDAEFEDAMVRLMDAVQRRLAYARLKDSVANASGRGANESGWRWKERPPGLVVPSPARLPRVAIGAAAFATLAAVVAVIMLLALSSGGGGRNSLVLQVTAIPQASESVSTPIATKPVTTPIATKPVSTPAPAQQTPTPLASQGPSAQVSAQPAGQGKLTAVTTPTGSTVEGQAATPTPASVAPKPQAVPAKAVPVLASASATVVPVRAVTAVTAALATPAVVSPSVLRHAPSTPKPIVAKAHPKKQSRAPR
jgi:hypothetical protein